MPDDVVDVLRARNDADGLGLDAHTATPGWFGESLDVGWAIDVLYPRAVGLGALCAFDDELGLEPEP